jgi:hypothetical protein
MNSIDLRVRAPRPPRERLDGLLFLPRTIDKICATFPGGHLGPYHIAPGMSDMLMTIIGVDLADFRAAVMSAPDEDAVAAWLRACADTSAYARANEVLEHWRHENIPPDHRADFESKYPGYLIQQYPVAFDLLEADDRELYPALRASVGIPPIPSSFEVP